MSTMKRPSNDKQKRLKEQGALNPHPEKVKDELFGDSGLDFFDPHDLVQVKYEMLRSVEKEGRSVTEASKRFGFSRPAFYQVQSQFKEGGITGFIRERPGPKSAHKVTPDVVQFIENRIKEGEPLRARALVALIKKEFNKKVHPRSIERAIARSKKKEPRKIIEPKTDRQLGDGYSLQYESLRFRVLEKNEAKRKGSLGLALFIRQGMLAWLEALYICASQRVAPAEGVNTRSIFAYSPQSEMTKILANITLFALGESES